MRRNIRINNRDLKDKDLKKKDHPERNDHNLTGIEMTSLLSQKLLISPRNSFKNQTLKNIGKDFKNLKLKDKP